MLPPNAPKQVIDRFETVNDVTDSVKMDPGMVPWSHGGYFNEKSYFKRMEGKKTISTSSGIGRVLAIAQLDFKNRSAIVIHHSSKMTAEDDMSAVRDTSARPNPLEPFMPC